MSVDEEQEEPRKPWEQQIGESAPAYEAFSVYRDMEPSERSYRRVAQQLCKSSALVNRWRAQQHWVARAQAWDRKVDNDALREAMKRHKTVLRTGAQWLAAPVSVLALAMQLEPLLPQMLAEELVRAAQRGHGLAAFDRMIRAISAGLGGGVAQLMNAERLAFGMTSENVAIGAPSDFSAGEISGADRAGAAHAVRAALFQLGGSAGDASRFSAPGE